MMSQDYYNLHEPREPPNEFLLAYITTFSSSCMSPILFYTPGHIDEICIWVCKATASEGWRDTNSYLSHGDLMKFSHLIVYLLSCASEGRKLTVEQLIKSTYKAAVKSFACLVFSRVNTCEQSLERMLKSQNKQNMVSLPWFSSDLYMLCRVVL